MLLHYHSDILKALSCDCFGNNIFIVNNPPPKKKKSAKLYKAINTIYNELFN